MPKNTAKRRNKRVAGVIISVLFAVMIAAMSSVSVFAAGDVSSAIQSTWSSAQTQIQNVVNNVVCCTGNSVRLSCVRFNRANVYLDRPLIRGGLIV